MKVTEMTFKRHSRSSDMPRFDRTHLISYYCFIVTIIIIIIIIMIFITMALSRIVCHI